MMLNKKSSRMSAWKALYVIPLVGISLAATAETKVDYQYEGQEPLKARIIAEANYTPDGKDNKNSFKEKNVKEGRLIVDEEAGTITMIYFDHNGNELRSQIKGMKLDHDIYLHNGNMATNGVFDKCSEEEDAVVLTAYMKNGKKVRGVVTPNNDYATGIWDVSKPFDEQETVYHKDGKAYKVRGGKYVEIEGLRIKGRDDSGNDVEVSQTDLVYVINGERKPEGFDLNTIDPDTIVSMEVLKTEKALKEYGTDKGVIVITTEPSKADEKKAVPDVYIDGKKATSEDIAALPANPKGSVAADGTVWITTEAEPKEKQQNCSPSFNGGTNADFQKWVQENIRYPEGATSEGRVSVSFTVSETGKIEDVKALSGSDRKLNDEAVRVISSSPDWAPATKDGKPVAIRMIIPVEFNK